MQAELDLNSDTHSRLNILTGDWVLVSPHRTKRPWNGKVEELPTEGRPTYDPACYLCPGNNRADGDVNPEYTNSFVFVNDFAALLENTEPASQNIEDLLIAKSERGICKVISFSPRHDLTLPEMELEAIEKVVDLWQTEFTALAQTEWIRYIQIFENKGDIMGCSNPHPHGQIWAQGSIPTEIAKESERQKNYYAVHRKTLLSDYLKLELKLNERIIINSKYFVALVPFWATWPFETMILSKRAVENIKYFSKEEKKDLAKVLKELTSRYDNLFNTSFPYSAGMHQAPVNMGDMPEWHWHMHFYPPLLRSATIKKFMVGYEMLASPQRDISAETAAERLRGVSDVHYKMK